MFLAGKGTFFSRLACSKRASSTAHREPELEWNTVMVRTTGCVSRELGSRFERSVGAAV